ncbi:hypothetical protein C8J56DRAFT_910899 [Mycena floridula]|nr:hypothetical protein C8J56DRAFT_910899 [Mycena floridula]
MRQYPEYPEPRHFRVGGFFIPPDVSADWASRLTGRPRSDPTRCQPGITRQIDKRVKEYGVAFYPVGDAPIGQNYMLVTRQAPFEGHTNMTPAEIPQFEEGELEEKARKMLDEQGVTGYKFATVLH